MIAAYLTNDLMFSSRVSSIAGTCGVKVVFANTPAALLQQVAGGDVSLVILDLEHPGADPGALVPELHQCSPPPRIIAYGPHVKESLLAAAQQAGCDQVLSRGQFDKQVRNLLDAYRAS